MKRNRLWDLVSVIVMLGLLSEYAVSEVYLNENKNAIRIRETVGNVVFDYTQANGLTISVGGTSVITSSSLFVVCPGWVEKYFLSTSEPYIDDVVVEDIDSGKRIVMTQSSSTDPTKAVCVKQIFTLMDNNIFIAEIDLEYKGDKPAVFEYKIGGINAILTAGRKYRITKGYTQCEGVIPFDPVGTTSDNSMLARDFDKMEIDSRIGLLEIYSAKGDDVCLFDYRGNMWAQPSDPVLWFGYLNKPIVKGHNIHYEVKIKFPKTDTDFELISSESNVSAEKVESVRVAKWGKNYVVPTPKELIYTQDSLDLSSRTIVYTGSEHGSELDNGISFMCQDLKKYFGISLVVLCENAPKDAVNSIIVGGDAANDICRDAGINLPANPQGYGMVVNDKVTAIAASSEKGLFNGIMTLLQLIALDNGRLYIKGARITDWPAMDMRGVHFFSGKGTSDQAVKMIRNVLARYKINTLLWQCDYVNWDKAGIDHKQIGMTKAEAKKVVIAAKDNNVEFIPLLATLGHAEWMFNNGSNLDIAEDPQTPYAYCPTNQRTYEYIFSIFDEILEFCIQKPRYFHIGHDEVTMIGRFPYRSKDSGMGVTELLMYDVNKLHSWFSERDIKIGLWGDMFIAPEEASSSAFAPDKQESQKRREMLPDDVLVFDWHYEVNSPEKFKSLSLFDQAGFDTVASTWFNSENIKNMAKAAADLKINGLMQTTWAGYNFSVDNNEQAWFQYWAYLWAAQYSWTGDSAVEADLDFSAADMFYEIWNELTPLKSDESGFVFDLSGLYNSKVDDLSGSAGYGDVIDLSGFPTGKALFNDTYFLIENSDNGLSSLMLNGNLNRSYNRPSSVILKIEPLNASSIHFLFTTTLRVADGQTVGKITFMDNDCESAVVELVYGRNIFAFNDARVTSKTRIAWRGKTASGKEVCVNEFVWNIDRKRVINSIKFDSSPSDSAIVLLGITTVD